MRAPLRVLGLTFALTAFACGQSDDPAAIEERARAIHERVMTLDTHVDIDPANFRPDAAVRYARRAAPPALPVVVVTGWSYAVDMAGDYDWVAVFEKPFDPDVLLKNLDTLRVSG